MAREGLSERIPHHAGKIPMVQCFLSDIPAVQVVPLSFALGGRSGKDRRGWTVGSPGTVRPTFAQNGVIRFGGGVFQAGPDVFGFEVGILFEDFRFSYSGGE